MKKRQPYIYLLAGVFLFSACRDQFSTIREPVIPQIITPSPASAGDADFTKYVAIGNSLTAGFMDGSVYNRGQENSYPRLLATQFSQAGGGAFNQPDINAENGFFSMSSDGSTILGRLRLNTQGIPSPIVPGDAIKPYSGDKNALNNFGVPGVSVVTALAPQLGNPTAGNPYYSRFASVPNTSTLIGDAAAAMSNGGTFFTFWLGANDILGYATIGADDILAASELSSPTNANVFRASYTTALNAILNASPEAKGLVANIPSIVSAPFFSTISYNDFELKEDKQVKQVNALYQSQIDSLLTSTVAKTVITIGTVTTQILPAVMSGLISANVITTADSTALYVAYASAFPDAFAANPSNPTPQAPNTSQQAVFNQITTQVHTQLASTAVISGIGSQLSAYLADPTNTNFTHIHTQVTEQVNTQITTLKQAGFYPEVSIGANPIIIEDANSPTGIRFAREGELILLTAASEIAKGPLSDRFVLTADEIVIINDIVNAFNEIIKTNAEAHPNRIVFVDMFARLNKIVADGVQTQYGVVVDPSIAPPFGIFSLDGIHPNARGYALIANIFIESINKKFDASLPTTNLNITPGNDFPQ